MKSKIAAFLFASVLASCAVAPAHAQDPNCVKVGNALEVANNDLGVMIDALSQTNFAILRGILNTADAPVSDDIAKARDEVLTPLINYYEQQARLVEALKRC